MAHVSLAGTRANDQTLDLLKTFADLDYLMLKGCKITDGGLKRLKYLRRLRSIDLDGTDVSNTGLVELAAIPTLESISLAGTQVTDAGLAHLLKLPRLDMLHLGRRAVESFSMQMTPTGPQPVPHVPADHRAETRITAQGLQTLVEIARLKSLDLRDGGAALR